nr:alginate export family protein [Edaphobacter lichenicola]
MLLCAHSRLTAQTATPPPYTPQVWDIDWSYLAEPAARDSVAADWTDRLHYIPLGDTRFLSINGQLRERGEYQDHPAFGAQPPDNGYLLQRYLFSADLHLSQRFRTFIQFDSGLIDGRDGGPRPGIDEDKLDVNQGFIDITPFKSADNNLTVRAGRQLISLGSTRLVATGAGLNVEQPFDGFRLTLLAGYWTADGIAVRPTETKTGFLDNEPNPAEELWGLYVSRALPSFHTNLDLYYFGYDHKSVRYAQGTGREQRETIGARIWSHTSTWDYDFEYTGQFGRFNTGEISAMGAGYHLGYTFTHARFAPHPEVDGGVLSGDHNAHDNTLGTFNPLFPNGNYLSQSILLGPFNLIIVRPTFKTALTRKVSSNTNVELLWRQATRDGVYNIVGILTHPPDNSTARSIGTQIQQGFDYNFTRHLSGSLVYEHFFAGEFLKQSPPGHSLNFISPQLTWNF